MDVENPVERKRYPVSFTGNGNEFFTIWIVNILLTVVTLYIYSAWAKVRTKRYFYGNTVVDGSSLEYHAKPLQILVGRLVAVVLLGLTVFGAAINPLVPTVVTVLLLLIIPWAVWRSMKFNMRMTSYRNVRFGFSGSLLKMYLFVLILPLLLYLPFTLVAVGYRAEIFTDIDALMLVVFALAAIATFVIAFWTQKIVTSYFLHNYLYGKSKFKGQLSVYRFAIVYGKAVAATFGLLGVLGLLIFFLGKGGGDGIFGILFGWFFEIVGGSVSPLVGGTLKYILVIIVGIVFYTGMLAFNFYVVAIVRAGIREHVYANATVDNRVSFESTVTAFGLFKISFINFLINIVTCGFGTPFTKVRMAKFLAAHTFVHSVGELDAFVGEKREEVGAFGDELGDAFDMDMDIGF